MSDAPPPLPPPEPLPTPDSTAELQTVDPGAEEPRVDEPGVDEPPVEEPPVEEPRVDQPGPVEDGVPSGLDEVGPRVGERDGGQSGEGALEAEPVEPMRDPNAGQGDANGEQLRPVGGDGPIGDHDEARGLRPEPEPLPEVEEVHQDADSGQHVDPPLAAEWRASIPDGDLLDPGFTIAVLGGNQGEAAALVHNVEQLQKLERAEVEDGRLSDYLVDIEGGLSEDQLRSVSRALNESLDGVRVMEFDGLLAEHSEEIRLTALESAGPEGFPTPEQEQDAASAILAELRVYVIDLGRDAEVDPLPAPGQEGRDLAAAATATQGDRLPSSATGGRSEQLRTISERAGFDTSKTFEIGSADELSPTVIGRRMADNVIPVARALEDASGGELQVHTVNSQETAVAPVRFIQQIAQARRIDLVAPHIVHAGHIIDSRGSLFMALEIAELRNLGGRPFDHVGSAWRLGPVPPVRRDPVATREPEAPVSRSADIFASSVDSVFE